MSWEVIRNVKPTPPKAAKVPPMGVSVAARKMGARGGKVVRYIKLGVGVKLAKELCLIGDQTGLRLSLGGGKFAGRSEEHTSELQSLMRISYAVFCLKKQTKQQ